MDVACLALLATETVLHITAFLTVRHDKRQATRRRGRRVPERNLLWFAVFGAGLGLLAGFWTYRHKTRKAAFQVRFWPAALLGWALLAGWSWALGCW